VGIHQLDPGQAAALEPAQELDPEGLGRRDAARHAEHLTATVGVGGNRDGHRDRDDTPGRAHLHHHPGRDHVGVAGAAPNRVSARRVRSAQLCGSSVCRNVSI
jgi:hypothetical protein